MTLRSSVVHFGSIRGSLQFCLLPVKVSLKPSRNGLHLLKCLYFQFLLCSYASLDSCLFLAYRQKATLPHYVKTHQTFCIIGCFHHLCSPAFSHVTHVFVFIVTSDPCQCKTITVQGGIFKHATEQCVFVFWARLYIHTDSFLSPVNVDALTLYCLLSEY